MVIGFPFSSEIYILSYKNDKKQIITQKDKNNKIKNNKTQDDTSEKDGRRMQLHAHQTTNLTIDIQ